MIRVRLIKVQKSNSRERKRKPSSYFYLPRFLLFLGCAPFGSFKGHEIRLNSFLFTCLFRRFGAKNEIFYRCSPFEKWRSEHQGRAKVGAQPANIFLYLPKFNSSFNKVTRVKYSFKGGQREVGGKVIKVKN